MRINLSKIYNLCLITFFTNKGKRPSEDIHEVWKPIGMWWAIELTNIHHIILVLQNGSWKYRADGNYKWLARFIWKENRYMPFQNVCSLFEILELYA